MSWIYISLNWNNTNYKYHNGKSTQFLHIQLQKFNMVMMNIKKAKTIVSTPYHWTKTTYAKVRLLANTIFQDRDDSSRYHLEPVTILLHAVWPACATPVVRYDHAACGEHCHILLRSGARSCDLWVLLRRHVQFARVCAWPWCTLYAGCSHGLHRVTDAVTPVRCRRDCRVQK